MHANVRTVRYRGGERSWLKSCRVWGRGRACFFLLTQFIFAEGNMAIAASIVCHFWVSCHRQTVCACTLNMVTVGCLSSG